MSEWVIGVLGGSGLYDLPEAEDGEWIDIDTPWGNLPIPFAARRSPA